MHHVLRTSKKDFSSGKLQLTGGGDLRVYNEIPISEPDGLTDTFLFTNSFQLNSLVLRVNGLTAAIGIDYLPINNNEIQIAYIPDATEKIHIDYNPL